MDTALFHLETMTPSKEIWEQFVDKALLPLPLSSTQALRLLDYFKIYMKDEESEKRELVMSFFSSSLLNSDQLCETVNNQDFDFLNELISMKKYFQSEDFIQDLEESQFAMETEREFSPNLELLAILHFKCPKYSTVTNFQQLGLPNDRMEFFEEFLKKSKLVSNTTPEFTSSKVFSKVFATKLLEQQHRELMERSKKGHNDETKNAFKNYVNTLCDSYEDRLKDLQERENLARNIIQELDNNSAPNMTSYRKQIQEFLNQVELRQKILSIYRSLFQNVFELSSELLNENSPLALSYIPSMRMLYQLMVQICDVSIAVVFIGLLKTGKSTIVNAIVGQQVSPSRQSPMTAIPTRYIHDPNITEPIMYVHFATSLNRVIRKIRDIVNKKVDKETTRDQVISEMENSLSDHLKELFREITKKENYLTFQNFYKGRTKVYQYSSTIQDLFRLVSHPIFPEEALEFLPLSWSEGLDYFLTVVLKFPGLEDSAANLLNFSVIDTPGVNESGVEKLNLDQAVKNVISSCHYVVFTLLPREIYAKDNAVLKDRIIETMKSYSIPSLVLTTHIDTIMGQNLGDLKTNVSSFLGTPSEPYPSENVFPVSGKRMHLGSLMLRELENKKPSLQDSDPFSRQVANDWVGFAGLGDDEKDKENYYINLPEQDLRVRCNKLIESSKMKEPLAHITSNTIENSAKSSTIISIKRALELASNFESSIKVLVKVQESSIDQIARAKLTSERVHSNLMISFGNLSTDLETQLQQFKNSTQTRLRTEVQNFISSELPENFFGIEPREYRKEVDAQTFIRDHCDVVKYQFNKKLSQVLSQKAQDFNRISGELRRTLLSFFDEVKKILQALNYDGPLDSLFSLPEFPQFDSNERNLDFQINKYKSMKKSTTLQKKLSQAIKLEKIDKKRDMFVVDPKEMRNHAIEQIQRYAKEVQEQIQEQATTLLDRVRGPCVFQITVLMSFINNLISRQEQGATSAINISMVLNEVIKSKNQLESLLLELDSK